MDTVLQLIFALIGLGFLVFIHELGHYWVARRVGMKVEIFSIGFGKPIHSWERDGVKWQIGWLPFGGFVKIAGMDPGEKDVYQIADGYFGKKPIHRILVALAGPIANLILAFVIFGAIWLSGGQEKPFSEFTHRIGWVDPNSPIYQKGIRPGDIISKFNGQQLTGFKDLIYAAMLTNAPVDLEGQLREADSNQTTPFEFKAAPYQYPGALDGMLTVGILSPARYLVYQKLPGGIENPLQEGSPMKNSGIRYGDQIVWANGDTLFSLEQLSELINEPRSLLRVQRGSETLLVRVPRVKVNELKLDGEMHGELTDWQHEAQLKTKFNQLFFIPYNLNLNGVVENQLTFIDPEAQNKAFPTHPRTQTIDVILQPGDRIISVDGKSTAHSSQILKELQEQHVQLIVYRGQEQPSTELWTNADEQFDQTIDQSKIQAIVSALGSNKPITQVGNYVLLNPVVPKAVIDFAFSPEKKAMLTTEILEQRKKIDGISDPDKRARALRLLEESQQKLILGVSLQDRQMVYNPPPQVLFDNVFVDTWRTMTSLFSGHLNPKWLSGPVGIVQVMQKSWSVGVKEALFWLAAISINLAMLNLLPIPVLDGGHIIFSLFELISRKRLNPKILERLILPFAVLLIGFIIFVTYYDITRLF